MTVKPSYWPWIVCDWSLKSKRKIWNWKKRYGFL